MEVTLAIISSMLGVTLAFLIDGKPLGETLGTGLIFFLYGGVFIYMWLAGFIVEDILRIDIKTNKVAYVVHFITSFAATLLLFFLLR